MNGVRNSSALHTIVKQVKIKSFFISQFSLEVLTIDIENLYWINNNLPQSIIQDFGPMAVCVLHFFGG
jgi:hypothetical protein